MYSRILTALFVLVAFAAFVAAHPSPAECEPAHTYKHGGLQGILEICLDLQVKVLAIIKLIVGLGVKADVSAHIREITVCINAAVKAIVSVCLAGHLDLKDTVTIQAIAKVIADIMISIHACVGVIATVSANVKACAALDLALKVLCLTLKAYVSVVVNIVAKLCAVVIDVHVNIVLSTCLRVLGINV
ncbi:hypothetical protein BKA62DRAFT_758288 [Auriculariales sp. MPI-PUGE-AT-0066]|nr:hypothetical protein BKA62DRAFT_758288 [Auriculariales sp. MPI-PUGE-AT-0066]